jgi:hypothetical protein
MLAIAEGIQLSKLHKYIFKAIKGFPSARTLIAPFKGPHDVLLTPQYFEKQALRIIQVILCYLERDSAHYKGYLHTRVVRFMDLASLTLSGSDTQLPPSNPGELKKKTLHGTPVENNPSDDSAVP